VRDIETDKLVDYASSIAGVDMVEGDPPVDGYLASFVSETGKARHLVTRAPLNERVKHLRAIVDIYYKGEARLDRVNHADVATLRTQHPHFGTLVTFPDFTKKEIRNVAEAGALLPSGVTRILVPRRVLGFNLRLPLLRSSLPLEEKRRWLVDEIRHKVSEHKVRYYQEPTFVFDD
jgi:hypothetical protein